MNTNIPFGRENKARKAKYRKLNEEYENQLAYSNIFGDVKVHNTTKDNTKWAYNGEGYYYKGNKVRIPSIKRSNRVWKNFYTLFPEYYELLQRCLNGELKHIKTNNCISCSTSDLVECTNFKNSFLKLKIVNM